MQHMAAYEISVLCCLNLSGLQLVALVASLPYPGATVLQIFFLQPKCPD